MCLFLFLLWKFCCCLSWILYIFFWQFLPVLRQLHLLQVQHGMRVDRQLAIGETKGDRRRQATTNCKNHLLTFWPALTVSLSACLCHCLSLSVFPSLSDNICRCILIAKSQFRFILWLLLPPVSLCQQSTELKSATSSSRESIYWAPQVEIKVTERQT